MIRIILTLSLLLLQAAFSQTKQYPDTQPNFNVYDLFRENSWH